MKKTILAIAIVLFSYDSFSQTKDSSLKKDTIQSKIGEINKNTLYNKIVEAGIEFPEIVLAQALLETGQLKSKLFKQNKNLFGMRLPKSRSTTAIGKKNYYAVYKNWEGSVLDYKLWQDRIPDKHMKNKTTYLSYLSRNYSKSKGYSKKLKKHM